MRNAEWNITERMDTTMTDVVRYQDRLIDASKFVDVCDCCGLPTSFDDGGKLVCDACDIELNRYGHWVDRQPVIYPMEHYAGGYGYVTA